jgi:hypothetical protein
LAQVALVPLRLLSRPGLQKLEGPYIGEPSLPAIACLAA